MVDLEKLKPKTKIIFIIMILSIAYVYGNTYAAWYEEPEIYETENIDSKWWLSRKQKEAEKQKQDIELNKKIEENKNRDFKDKNIRWLYSDFDATRFPKNKWEIIDDDGDSIGYNYYFDKDGYLLIDTITPDYKIVDIKGREVDYNLRPIKYEINKNIIEEDNSQDSNNINFLYNLPTREQSKVIIGEGVVLKKQEKIFDHTINKDVVAYASSSNRFIKETIGTIYNEIRWLKCCSLGGNGGYVIFNNPQNNFNKITGYISTQYDTSKTDSTIYTLKVYDADLYDKYNAEHHLYDIDEIYANDHFNVTDDIRLSFTFDRSIKRLRFEIEAVGKYLNKTCYFKDLKYGFSKTAFAEELKRKKEDEEEIEELKRLGIYIEDYTNFDALDDDGNIIYEDGEIDDDFEEYRNDFRYDYSLDIYEEETKSYEDRLQDSDTGPAFDENLQNIKQVGPAFIDIE